MDETKKCPFCAEEILADARKCKHCDEYLDDSLKEKVQSKNTNVEKVSKKPLNRGCLIIVAISIGFLLVAYIVDNISNKLSRQSTVSKFDESSDIKKPDKSIPYEIVREWQVPNGGYGKIIVISPQYRNGQDLRLLGLNLRYDTRYDRNAFIDVFDNKKAADLSKTLANLSEKEGALFDKHKIGQYTRNINTGYHRFQIWVNGINSEEITIDYSKQKD